MLVLNIMIVIYIYIINKIFLDNYCNKGIVIILLFKKENNQEQGLFIVMHLIKYIFKEKLWICQVDSFKNKIRYNRITELSSFLLIKK